MKHLLTLEQIKQLSHTDLILRVWDQQQPAFMMEVFKERCDKNVAVFLTEELDQGFFNGPSDKLLAFLVNAIKLICTTYDIEYKELLGELIAESNAESGNNSTSRVGENTTMPGEKE